MIECRTLFNETKLVPKESLIQRVSVYGIVTNEDKVLLLETPHTGKYAQPGGGVEKGETLDDALKREIREEAGIEIEVGDFGDCRTDFFYYDPLDIAIHGFLFFYYCKPLTFDLLAGGCADSEEGFPCWVDINILNESSFQNQGKMMMKLLRKVSV